MDAITESTTCPSCGGNRIGRMPSRESLYCKECMKRFRATDKRDCKHCGREFVRDWTGSRGWREVCCSAECGGKWKSNPERLGKKVRDAFVTAIKREAGAWTRKYFQTLPLFICRNCGHVRLKEKAYEQPSCQECTVEVSRICHLAVSQRRRARKKGSQQLDYFKPTEIFARDNNTCQICGKKVAKTKRCIPRQATIDHIVPLSKGGDHTEINCQTACRECNVRKGAKSGGQLRLIA